MKQTAIYQKKRAHHTKWFNKWIQSPVWLSAFGIACLVALTVYLVNALVGELHPGNIWGLSYGIGAAILLLAVMAYSLRRRLMRIRKLPRSWHYLQVHVYGGGLFLLMMLMHSNFQLPNGIITWWLWGLSIWTVVSGLIGIALQKWIPTMLNTGLSTEVHYDRIPDLIAASGERAQSIIEKSSDMVREFYEKHLEYAFEAPKPRLIYYLDAGSSIQRDTQKFDHVRPYLSDDEQEGFDELKMIYKTKLEMDAHYTLQRALRWWIYGHAPFSVMLIVLLIIHIVSVLYY